VLAVEGKQGSTSGQRVIVCEANRKVGKLMKRMKKELVVERELLNVLEVAELLGVSEVTVRRYRRCGLLRGYRVAGSRLLRFKSADVENLLVLEKATPSEATS